MFNTFDIIKVFFDELILQKINEVTFSLTYL